MASNPANYLATTASLGETIVTNEKPDSIQYSFSTSLSDNVELPRVAHIAFYVLFTNIRNYSGR